MEYCDGGSLLRKIESQRKLNKPFDEKLVAIWMAQVGMALKRCHKTVDNKKILHRDVMSKNIFLMADGFTCKPRVNI